MKSEKELLKELINQISDIKSKHEHMNDLNQREGLAKIIQEALNTIHGLIYHAYRPSCFKRIIRKITPFISRHELAVCCAIEMQPGLNESKNMVEKEPNYSVPYPTDQMHELALLDLKNKLYKTLTPKLNCFLILNRQYFPISW